MMTYTEPLRYQISDWHQLPGCKSNNDKCLKISITDFIQDPRLSGTRISVEHPTFGNLFTYIVDLSGNLISNLSLSSELQTHLSIDDILLQLSRFGFLITYKEYEHLSGNQLQFLMTINNLHFDKIRLLNVWDVEDGVKQFKLYVVAFQVEPLSQWLNAGYAPSNTEFQNALNSGYALNVSALSEAQSFSWDWLYNWVADISDIIESNSIK